MFHPVMEAHLNSKTPKRKEKRNISSPHRQESEEMGQ